MRPTKRFAFLICVSLLATPTFAAIRPSFSLDRSAWKATHIVIAVTTSTGGTFEVVESLKGDLHAGDRLVIPDLRPPSDAQTIGSSLASSEFPLCHPGSHQIPKQPAGSRVILFLVDGDDRGAGDKGDLVGWKPSDLLHSMQASVIWIEGGDLYAFMQVINPGLPLLCELRESQADVMNRVDEIDRTQAQMVIDLSSSDGAERAEGLKKYLSSSIFPVRLAAMDELGKSGPSAIPVISTMIDDPALTSQEPELIHELADAGGITAGPELTRRLQRELEFWKSKGPSLRQGWWNEDLNGYSPFRAHDPVTYELIIGLKKIRYRGALSTVLEFQKVWRTVPRADNNSTEDEIGNLCEELIRALKPDESKK